MNSLLAEFADDRQLIAAVRGLSEGGHGGMEVFTPFPLPVLDDVLRKKPSRIPACVFLGGLAGAVLGYGIQWATIADYPLRVASFPSVPVPALIPITFESMILGAALTAFVAVFVGSGMFQWWHPYDEIEGFERASIDRFFLALPITGEQAPTCRRDLDQFQPLRVITVEAAP